MTKQEKIQEAYGEYWKSVKDYVDENGFIIMAISIIKEVNLVFERKVMYHSKNTSGAIGMCVRPISLENIENNNGWIKIESEEDLPKQNIMCWALYEDKEEPTCIRFINGKWVLDFGKITHYQPIAKPQPPLY